MQSILGRSTLPMLEQVVAFTEERHGVLAGNIANIHTPGYKTRDLSPERFRDALRTAIEVRDQPASESAAASREFELASLAEVTEARRDLIYHDDTDINLESQVAELSKNRAEHNLAISIMSAQYRQLRTAITERVT